MFQYRIMQMGGSVQGFNRAGAIKSMVFAMPGRALQSVTQMVDRMEARLTKGKSSVYLVGEYDSRTLQITQTDIEGTAS